MVAPQIGLAVAGAVAARPLKRPLSAVENVAPAPQFVADKPGGVFVDDELLVVGDGNFTFSKLLSNEVKKNAKQVRLICTTLDDLDTLKQRYPEVDEYIEGMKNDGTEVLHGVDATRLPECARSVGHDWENRFHCCIWNFPHAGVISGFLDTNPLIRWRHVNLMRRFFFSVRAVLKPQGCVVVTSNAKTKHVTEDEVIQAAITANFELEEQFPFPEWIYSSYERCFGDSRDDPSKRRRLDRKSHNWYPSQKPELDRVYVFRMLDEAPEEGTMDRALMPPPDITNLVQAVSTCACGLICPTDKKYFFQETRHFQLSGKCREFWGQEKLQALQQKFSGVSFTALAPEGFVESLANTLEIDMETLCAIPGVYTHSKRRWIPVGEGIPCGEYDFCSGGAERLYEDENSQEWFCVKCWTRMLGVSEEDFLHAERDAVKTTAERVARRASREHGAEEPESCENEEFCRGDGEQGLTQDPDSTLWFCQSCWDHSALEEQLLSGAPIPAVVEIATEAVAAAAAAALDAAQGVQAAAKAVVGSKAAAMANGAKAGADDAGAAEQKPAVAAPEAAQPAAVSRLVLPKAAATPNAAATPKAAATPPAAATPKAAATPPTAANPKAKAAPTVSPLRAAIQACKGSAPALKSALSVSKASPQALKQAVELVGEDYVLLKEGFVHCVGDGEKLVEFITAKVAGGDT